MIILIVFLYFFIGVFKDDIQYLVCEINFLIIGKGNLIRLVQYK